MKKVCFMNCSAFVFNYGLAMKGDGMSSIFHLSLAFVSMIAAWVSYRD